LWREYCHGSQPPRRLWPKVALGVEEIPHVGPENVAQPLQHFVRAQFRSSPKISTFIGLSYRGGTPSTVRALLGFAECGLGGVSPEQFEAAP
jgi:hypothetical protein